MLVWQEKHERRDTNNSHHTTTQPELWRDLKKKYLLCCSPEFPGRRSDEDPEKWSLLISPARSFLLHFLQPLIGCASLFKYLILPLTDRLCGIMLIYAHALQSLINALKQPKTLRTDTATF